MSARQKAYIVFIGDVGVGKSTLFEKITGLTGRSSRSDVSFTRVSELGESFDNRIIVCDTPGMNAMDDRFQHNINVAHALNYQPISRIVIVVKADERLDGVIEKVSEAVSSFLPEDLPLELLSVCVTHMDNVQWDKARLLQVLEDKVGIESAITSSLSKTGEDLLSDLVTECGNGQPKKMDVDSEMFLKLFKISNSNVKVMRQVRKEVNKFTLVKSQFNKLKREGRWTQKDLMDMTFEFQAWMFDEITGAQKRLTKHNNFDFMGPNMASHAGHVANMTNQLRKILSSVRIDSMKFHKDLDTNFRKCPWCPAVWQKIEGCDGDTTCGNRVNDSLVSDNWSGGITAHFSFLWDREDNRLVVSKRSLKAGEKKTDNIDWRRGTQAGCGKPINWSQMAPVVVPVEYNIDPASTADVRVLQEEHLPEWKEFYNRCMKQLKFRGRKSRRHQNSRF